MLIEREFTKYGLSRNLIQHPLFFFIGIVQVIELAAVLAKVTAQRKLTLPFFVARQFDGIFSLRLSYAFSRKFHLTHGAGHDAVTLVIVVHGVRVLGGVCGLKSFVVGGFHGCIESRIEFCLGIAAGIADMPSPVS